MVHRTSGSNAAGRPGLLKRCGAVVLAAVLFCTLFHFPASAEQPEAACDEVVDIVTRHYNSTAMVALLADGTVRTAGLEESFDAAEIAAIEAWTDIVQVVSVGMDFLGLKSDGTVVSTMREGRTLLMPEDPFDPGHWTNVKELVTSEFEYYAVTNDGRILVSNDSPEYSFGGGGPYLSWDDIDTVCFYAYPEARGLVGLRRDGTLAFPGSYGFFSESPENVTAIDSSGYIHCALLKDGTIRVAGSQLAYSEIGLVESAAAIRDAVQIAVDDHVVLCRLSSGEVKVCQAAGADRYPGVRAWENMRDVQLAGRVAFGLNRFGLLYTAPQDDRADWLPELCSEIASWHDIVRFKAYDGFGYEDPYVIGWRADGSVVTAGLDISGLKLEQSPAVRYTDAVYIRSVEATVALRDDGTLASAGLDKEVAEKIGKWHGIRQICSTDEALYALRADGIVEAASVTAGKPPAEVQAGIDAVLSWRDIQSLASTNLRVVGLKEDGSIAVGGPAHFGMEEKADFSDWTDLVALYAGSSIGGEYLVGLKTDGIVYKGPALVGDWYGEPRRAVEAACSGFQILCVEQDRTVSSLGFPGVTSWYQVDHVWALDGLALGLKRDATVLVDVLEGYFPEEAAAEIRNWKDVRGLSVGGGSLVVGVTYRGQTLVAESEELIDNYGRECVDTIRAWTNLDRILWADYTTGVLALLRNGTLVSCGIPIP